MKLIFKYLIVSGLFFSVQVFAANPNLEWRTHSSEHFLVHYPKNLSHFVRKVTALAENSHDSLSVFFLWTPKDKTHIVLLDDFDQSNGFAQPMPNNTITLYMQPPTDGELLVYDDWLKMLIHHEYTHVLHVDKVLGFPSLLRRVFGRIIFSFPNALHPNWFTEGLATFQETNDEMMVGRGQSDLFEIMMRTEVEAGIKPVSRINTVNAHSWPLNTAYLYGVYFFKFIHDVYGENAIKALVNNYSDNIIPYMVDSNSISVTGKSLEQLWPDFERYLIGYFQPQLDRIKSTEQTEFKVLSGRHSYYGLIAKGREREIWYSAVDQQLGPQLYRYRLGQEQVVSNLNSLATLDVNESGTVLVSQLEYCGQNYRYYDLYLLAPDEKSELKKITSCSRYRFAKWVDNERIMALRYQAGIPYLDLISDKGDLIKPFWVGKEGSVISGFDVDKRIDGTLNVIAAIKFGVDDWNLYQFVNDDWKSITQDSISQTLPTFMDNEIRESQQEVKSITYVATGNGQSEAHELNSALMSKRLSHTYTGLKQFVSIDDSTEVGLRYSGAGYEVVQFKRLEYSGLYSKKSMNKDGVSNEVFLSQEEKVTEQGDILLSDELYQPYRSMLPTYWFPIYVSDTDTNKVGLLTGGSDAINTHLYNVQLTYETKTESPLLNADYLYDNKLLIGVNQDVTLKQTINVNDRDIPIYERSNTIFAGYIASYMKNNTRWYPYAAISKTYDYLFYSKDKIKLTESVQNNWLAAGAIYDDTISTNWSGGASSGWQANFTFESANALNNNVTEGNVVSIDVKHYMPFNQHQTLAQRLLVAYGHDSNSLFQLGGAESDAYVGPGIQINQRRYPLRGFAKGQPKLTGTNLFLHSLEYRLPVSWVDSTGMSPPIGLGGWSLRGFVDSGATWSDSEWGNEVYNGIGAEVILDGTLGYYLGLRVRIGVAKGLGSEGEDSVYMELGGSF